KLLNLENPSPSDNEIASLMETTDRHATAVPENTFGFTITIPPPPLFFNPLLQQAIATPTPTTSEATTLFPSILDCSSVFRFNDRVTNLEKDLDNKLGEAINKVIQAHNLDYIQEAQDEKNAYIELVDIGVEMKKTKIETPLLDQTKGGKEGNQVKMLSPPEIQEEPSPTVEDSGMQQDQEFVTRDNDEQPVDKEVTKAEWFKKPKRPPTPDPD
ncbi:hypothetical protein Tco_1139218, partial [Tanacetum coccineum]